MYAFRRLAAELTVHGAPRRLVAAARRAAVDEVRHARVIGALACARGVVPERAVVATIPVRTLGEVVIENAVEGCVNETWSALVALHQARALGEPWRAVAYDEVRHAELAAAVHSWAMPRLTSDERGRVSKAQRSAIVSLRDIAYPRVLSLPTAVQVQRLHAGLCAQVWGA